MTESPTRPDDPSELPDPIEVPETSYGYADDDTDWPDDPYRNEAPADRKRRLRTNLIVATAVVVAAIFGISVLIFSQLSDAEVADTKAAAAGYRSAVTVFFADQMDAQKSVNEAEAAVAEAQEVLDGSAGKTFDNIAREQLADAIKIRSAEVKEAADAVSAAALPDVKPKHVAWDHGVEYVKAAKKIAAIELPTAAAAAAAKTDILAAPAAAVVAAQAAWRKEQDRLNTIAHTEWVRTAGFQSEIDACDGSVDISDNYWGKRTVAEHWSCGGRDFPTAAGAIVEFSGVVSGKFEVIGVVARLNVNTDGVADVPSGFDLLYQTCWAGDSSDMTFVGLRRVA
ncbi:hypothetical protein [Leifsonia sp. Leaf264]|uniref:hypothetical protein n=1 Tax=Leifsonia sp. Leaf264 TaxID=1736314 RepID=UPI0006F9476F|nr:hypothetical protein [Leifsonia sp. Leaf264]KQO98671.1 hypothetical protein ASF30_11455 [Leifsonia sp. Leaf264]